MGENKGRSEMTNFTNVLNKAKLIKGQKMLYDKGLRDGIMRKKPIKKAMKHWDKVRNRLISKRRFVLERTFGTLKRVCEIGRTRYISTTKSTENYC